MFIYAPGEFVFPMTLDQYREYGEHIARFHGVSADFKSRYHRFEYGHEKLLDTPLRILTDFFGKDDEGGSFIRDLVPRVKKELDSLSFPDDSQIPPAKPEA